MTSLEPIATFHQRPLPADLVSFTSPEGRVLLQEALVAGTAEAFFPLVANLHTQSEPAWCGLGTLVTVLNALSIDPGRTWKGPWRWFGEELLTCCKSLDLVTAEGLTLHELACLAACNGAQAVAHPAIPGSEGAFREELERSVRAPAGPFVVANYGRGPLGQTGDGHFSPLAAWHPGRDLVLVLDVARFKYPPHWVPVSRLWTAMAALDSATGAPRGWVGLERGTQGVPAVEIAALVARLGSMGLDCPAVPAAPVPAG